MSLRLGSSALKMSAIYSSETLVLAYKSIRRHATEDHRLRRFVWLRTESGSCEHGNEPSVSIKGVAFLYQLLLTSKVLLLKLPACCLPRVRPGIIVSVGFSVPVLLVY